jgi:LysR family transcriptional regulator for bpeEF and oprC
MTFHPLLAAPYLENGTLIPAFERWSANPIPVYVVYPPNRHLSAKVRVFVDWLAELFSQLDLVEQKKALGKS